jgi:hypothetical protein
MPSTGPADPHDVPTRLLGLLERIGDALARRSDAIALLGVGSVGTDLHRLDEHSDADFWVIVEDPAPYLRDLTWLEEAATPAWSLAHTRDGRKVLFDDGLFAEYAVFTIAELRALPRPATRVIWQRPGAPRDLAAAALPASEDPTVEHQAGEAITNLYVGLHRHLRGEVLAATRLIQHHAVDRVITILELLGHATTTQQDPFAVERSVERRLAAPVLPLAELVPGYGRNAEAAAAMLGLLDEHCRIEPVARDAVRELVGRVRFVEG